MGADTSYKLLLTAIVTITFMSFMINIFMAPETPLNNDEVMEGYYNMTGTKPTSESVWALRGIYTPYGTGENGAYGFTDDGWLYGQSIVNYSPSQYTGDLSYTVHKGDDGLFRYYVEPVVDDPTTPDDDDEYQKYQDIINKKIPVTPYGNYYYGDLYSDVSFDVMQKSNIFFTESLKHTENDGRFWYQYSGYRYSFSPLRNYTTVNTEKQPVEVIANTTSLSLIWYSYYYQTGISGQLIISGSSQGVSYLTAEQVVQAFNSTTSTARFTMAFNGVDMNIYIKLSPFALSRGMTVEECYNVGFWSVMVTSFSTDTSAIEASNYSLSFQNILETVWNIFTFNYSNYGIDGAAGIICTIFICIPFYASILTFGLEYKWVAILAGAVAAIQGIGTLFGTGLFG